MSFLSELTHAPPLSRLSRYIVANGVLYGVLGTSMLLLPGDWLATALLLDGWQGQEEGLVRLLGFVLVVVGWFYVMGGRTGASSFALSTVVDRALVPLVMAGLWATGQVTAGLVIGVAVLDPLMGLGAYLLWRSERGT